MVLFYRANIGTIQYFSPLATKKIQLLIPLNKKIPAKPGFSRTKNQNL